jgi:hypothetical protein
LDRFARVVLGYHGCITVESVDFARQLLDGSKPIAEWRPSANDYDWLGHGIYFWEHSPERARRWAGPKGGVIGAVIQLGRCFDLTDIRYTGLLRDAYDQLLEAQTEQGLELPRNEGREWKLRKLDCLVIQQFMDAFDAQTGSEGGFQTVRCPFEEGDEAFPGSMLRKETHIQIAVRDTACILGVFRPNI